MKTFKKFLTSIALALIVIVGAGILTACGDSDPETPTTPAATPNFTPNTTAVASINTSIEGIMAKAYNNATLKADTTKSSYTVAELNEKLTRDFTYYIEAGTLENYETVTSITLGGETFTSDKKVSVSIGNNQFIKDFVFKVSDNKLLVAAPIFAYETRANATIKINDDTYSLTLTPNAATFTFGNSPTITMGTSTIAAADVTHASEYDYVVTIKDGKSLLNLDYTGAAATDHLVTKKYYNGEVNSYGLTRLESNNKLGVYLVNWSADLNGVNSYYNNKVLEYKVYHTDKGLATVRVKLVFDTPAD